MANDLVFIKFYNYSDLNVELILNHHLLKKEEKMELNVETTRLVLS